MDFQGTGRSGDRRVAHLVLAIAIAACHRRDDHRAIDAGAVDAVVLDAPVAIVAVAADAAAPPSPEPTSLVAAGDSTCAVLSDLTVRCWGANAHGQLGSGLTADATRPITPAIRAVAQLQLADATACALLDDASVACWGRIGWHGRAEDVLRPTGVPGVTGAKQIFVLPGRACARVANDSLVCWGNIDARGHFAAGPTNRAPTPVVGLDHIADLRPEGAFSDDGRLWYWQRDGVPRRLAVSGVEELADRDGVLCARLHDGTVMCAPSDHCGPRRTPAPPPAAKPGKPSPSSPSGRANASKPSGPPSPSGRASSSSASGPPGKSNASGPPGKPNASNSSGKSTSSSPSSPSGGSAAELLGEPADPLTFPAARHLAFGLGFCVVTTTGKLQCGDGCRRLDPVKLDRVDSVVGRCALLRSRTVSCFDDVKGTAVPGVTRASLLAVGRAHACALVDGRIACWGDDDHGQLGGFAIAR